MKNVIFRGKDEFRGKPAVQMPRKPKFVGPTNVWSLPLGAWRHLAKYVWCNSHRSNQMINAVCSAPIELKGAIAILEQLHVFKTGYKPKAAFLEEQGKGRRT